MSTVNIFIIAYPQTNIYNRISTIMFVEKRYLSIIFWNNLEYSGISSLPFQYQDTIYVDSKFYIQLYGGLGESYSITCIHGHTSIIFYIVFSIRLRPKQLYMDL